MAKTLADTMGNVKAKVLSVAFADGLLVVGLKILRSALTDVMAEKQIDALLKWVAQHCPTLGLRHCTRHKQK